ncbi:MAG: hypothetical protein BroJett013_36850 [Alphaproteobacteria bacterium]|nr:MAG: hypothetical protein BroJett013_36850 [Alphaproteobacteria bacterium]
MTAGERDAIAAISPTKRPTGARDRDKKHVGSRQLSLFDVEVAEAIAAPVEVKAPPLKSISTKPALSRAGARVTDERPSHVLCVDDMPAYSDEAHESVAAALEALPQAQLWFTYKDIQFFFGVSRATVARRLREGLVPGVRMAGSSVMEDAAVRRFDRSQLKWLLLALRHRSRQRGR